MDTGMKPCKICGTNRYRIIAYGHAFTSDITYRVSCIDCSYCTNEKDTRQKAVDIWNTPLPNWVNLNKRKKSQNG